MAKTTVVLASGHDLAARRFVDSWQDGQAALLTARDLSRGGWRHFPADREGSVAVIAGRPLGELEISAVLVRLPVVTEDELAGITPSECAYVAAEMTAFLSEWLTGLPCPVLDRPTTRNLCGPGWSPEQWILLAMACGLHLRPVRRTVALGRAAQPPIVPTRSVTVVGDDAFGATTEREALAAVELARAADAELLRLMFDGAAFLGADTWLDLDSADVRGAVSRRLRAVAA